MTTADVARAALMLVEPVPLGAGREGDIRLTALTREQHKACKRLHADEPGLCFECARRVALAWSASLLERLDLLRARTERAENLLCAIAFEAGRVP